MEIQPQFYDHEVVKKSPQDYVEFTLSPSRILKAWQSSLFAHELLDKDANVKDDKDMAPETYQRYIDATEALKRREAIAKPVIGIGIMDGVEIGIGREIIAACQTMGVDDIPVSVRRAQADDIKSALHL